MSKSDSVARIGFLKHAITTLVCAGMLVFIVSEAALLVRYWFVALPSAALLFVAYIYIKRMSDRKRQTKREANVGENRSFMEIENQSGWITAIAILSSLGGGTALLLLSFTHNLMHYWYITVPAGLLTAAGLIFTPTPAGDY